MKILAVETSCDETAICVLEGNPKTGNFEIISNIVSSQVKIHQQWGGVVPNLAAREHIRNIEIVLKKALKKAQVSLAEIDLFAVTKGPGLIPALLIGTNFAKSLAYFCEKPLVGIHHIEGHIFACYLDEKNRGNMEKFEFPVLALAVSGGHTQLVLMKNFLEYEIIGQTQDDAVGEAFDKIAKIMDLGYPGGPIVSEMAEVDLAEIEKIENIELRNSLGKIKFPRPMIASGNLDFSFSGLKTAVLYFWEKVKEQSEDKQALDIAMKVICQKAQGAIVEVLIKKSLDAVEKFPPKTFLLCGGVAANRKLRDDLEENISKMGNEKIKFACPTFEYCGDNSAMIAVSAFCRFIESRKDEKKKWGKNWKNLEATANLEL